MMNRVTLLLLCLALLSPFCRAMDAPVQPQASSAVKIISLKARDAIDQEHVFAVPEPAARYSEFVSSVLDGNYSETATRTIEFQEIKAETLKRIVDYMLYKAKYDNTVDPPKFEIQPDEALDLLMASNFLGL